MFDGYEFVKSKGFKYIDDKRGGCVDLSYSINIPINQCSDMCFFYQRYKVVRLEMKLTCILRWQIKLHKIFYLTQTTYLIPVINFLIYYYI